VGLFPNSGHLTDRSAYAKTHRSTPALRFLPFVPADAERDSSTSVRHLFNGRLGYHSRCQRRILTAVKLCRCEFGGWSAGIQRVVVSHGMQIADTLDYTANDSGPTAKMPNQGARKRQNQLRRADLRGCAWRRRQICSGQDFTLEWGDEYR